MTFKSWSQWGRERGERSLLKSHDKEIQEALEDQEVSVFIIVNEWTDIANTTSSEVVGGNYFTSEDGAWEALRDIAAAYDTELDRDETSLQFEDHKPHLQFEEYYIQELTRVS